jgi:putative GTP pyrophosphokinase
MQPAMRGGGEPPPTPTNTPDQRGPVREAVQAYAALHQELSAATEAFVVLLTSLLDDAGINYLSVTGRTKSVSSFAAKALREERGQPMFTDPLTQITDQIGLRVITYLHDDVDSVASLLSDQFTILDDRDMGQETADDGRWGYASRHMLVGVEPTRIAQPPLDTSGGPGGHRASVQVRTVLQHAWAQFEHDIRYKGTMPDEHAPDLNRRFTLAAGLLELADREFTAIRDRVQATMTDRRPESDLTDPRISAQELATFLAGKYADAAWSRTDHYVWISGLLLELGITSLQELDALLSSVDSAVVHDRMGYRYPPGAVRRLDDALLAVFGDRYVGLHGNSHRVPQLKTRRAKLSMPPTV